MRRTVRTCGMATISVTIACLMAACGQNATPRAATSLPHATTATGASTGVESPSGGASTVAGGASSNAGRTGSGPDAAATPGRGEGAGGGAGSAGSTAPAAGGGRGAAGGTAPAAGGGAGSGGAGSGGAGRVSPTKQGLDQPVGSFGNARGVSGVRSNSRHVVTGFILDFTKTDGARVALSRAKAELAAYLPSRISYGAESVQGSCHALQILGSAKPATATFCSTSATQPGTYSASAIAEVIVANEPGFN